MVERLFGAVAAAVMIIASLGALAYRGISGVLDPVKWAEAGGIIAESEANKERERIDNVNYEALTKIETIREIELTNQRRIQDRLDFEQRLKEEQYRHIQNMERSDMMVAAEVFAWYAIMIMAIIAALVMAVITLIWATNHIRIRYRREPQRVQTVIVQAAPAHRTQSSRTAPFYDEDRWHRDPIWRYQQIRLARDYEAANRQEEVTQQR